jgi:TRAP-type uncharacterized transport system fused permease subunit
MVDIDARRFGNGTVASESTATVWHHLLQHDYFFLSLTAIVPMSLVGFSLNMAVFWAIPVAEAVGFIRRDSRLNRLLKNYCATLIRACAVLGILMYSLCTLRFLRSGRTRLKAARDVFQQTVDSPRLAQALASGSTGVVDMAVTRAAAGIVVGVVALTGLGLEFAPIVVSYAGGSLFLTAQFTALVVGVVGLAVPVTASYIN